MDRGRVFSMLEHGSSSCEVNSSSWGANTLLMPQLSFDVLGTSIVVMLLSYTEAVAALSRRSYDKL